jgi:hypothetical protein
MRIQAAAAANPMINQVPAAGMQTVARAVLVLAVQDLSRTLLQEKEEAW